MAEISVIYHKATGLRKEQMRTRHQGGCWNEQVAGGQPQSRSVLGAVEPLVTTHNLFMGAKPEPDALKSWLSSSSPKENKKHALPNRPTMLKIRFLSSLQLNSSLRMTLLYGQALESGSRLFSLKLKEEVRKTAAMRSIQESQVRTKAARKRESHLRFAAS